MNTGIRRMVLNVNAVYLGAAACMGLLALDLRGVVFGTGPESHILAVAPDAAVGFIEAHGLALILAITLWRSAATRAAHFTGAAASGLLGVCNLAFWNIFVAADALMLGYVTTSFHCGVAAAQLVAGIMAQTADHRRPVTEPPGASAARV